MNPRYVCLKGRTQVLFSWAQTSVSNKIKKSTFQVSRSKKKTELGLIRRIWCVSLVLGWYGRKLQKWTPPKIYEKKENPVRHILECQFGKDIEVAPRQQSGKNAFSVSQSAQTHIDRCGSLSLTRRSVRFCTWTSLKNQKSKSLICC